MDVLASAGTDRLTQVYPDLYYSPWWNWAKLSTGIETPNSARKCGPPPAHGARSRRRGNTATPPHKAAHTATGGARDRLWA